MNEKRAIHLIIRFGDPRKSVVRKIDGKWWVITMRWEPRMVAFGSHAKAVECAHALEVFNRRPR